MELGKFNILLTQEERIIANNLSTYMKTEAITASRKKGLLILSIVVFLYFVLQILATELNYDAVVVGVIIELLTLPFLAILIVNLILSIQAFVKLKFKFNSYPFYSIVILVITVIILVAFA